MNTQQAIRRILKARLNENRVGYKTTIEAYMGSGTDLAVKVQFFDKRSSTLLAYNSTPRLYFEYYKELTRTQFNNIHTRLEMDLLKHASFLNFNPTFEDDDRYKYMEAA